MRFVPPLDSRVLSDLAVAIEPRLERRSVERRSAFPLLRERSSEALFCDILEPLSLGASAAAPPEPPHRKSLEPPNSPFRSGVDPGVVASASELVRTADASE